MVINRKRKFIVCKYIIQKKKKLYKTNSEQKSDSKVRMISALKGWTNRA